MWLLILAIAFLCIVQKSCSLSLMLFALYNQYLPSWVLWKVYFTESNRSVFTTKQSFVCEGGVYIIDKVRFTF